MPVSYDEKDFFRAISELKASPYWAPFISYMRKLSADADTAAIMAQTNEAVLQGRARGYREILRKLETDRGDR